MGKRTRRGAPALALALILVLAACDLTGGSRPSFEQDAPTGKYYEPAKVDRTAAGVTVQLPDLPVEGAVSLEGRFSDPDQRAPIPAQDDHWWQAVVELSPEQSAKMLQAATTAASKPGAGQPHENEGDDAHLDNAGPMDTADDAAIRARIVAPLESALPEQCGEDWVLLGTASPELGDEVGFGQRLAGGDILVVAALCPGKDVLALDAHEF